MVPQGVGEQSIRRDGDGGAGVYTYKCIQGREGREALVLAAVGSVVVVVEAAAAADPDETEKRPEKWMQSS